MKLERMRMDEGDDGVELFCVGHFTGERHAKLLKIATRLGIEMEFYARPLLPDHYYATGAIIDRFNKGEEN
jgi:hypothetical protein